MPLEYRRDDARQRITLTASGKVQLEDFLAALERQRTEGTRGYGLLYDLRATSFSLPTARLRELAANEGILQPDPSRGPVALLAADPASYGTACAYAAIRRGTLTFQVFQDAKEADVWLTAAGTKDPVVD